MTVDEMSVDKVCGGQWLAKTFDVDVCGDLAVHSSIGTNRRTRELGLYTTEIYPPQMAPDPTPADHLQFHIRHEPINLELLARVFQASGPDFVQTWIRSKPTSQYARRAAFLYEFLTGAELQQPSDVRGSYVPALNVERNLAATSEEHGARCSKWKVIDNMPGTRFFCPSPALTPELQKALEYSIPLDYAQIVEEFGEELLSRSASWLTTRESRASFAIERESKEHNRITRFAQVITEWTGLDAPAHLAISPTSARPSHDDGILSEWRLGHLQRAILGETALISAVGYRKSPVFVGQTSHHSQLIHYLAPPSDDIARMLEGIGVFLKRTAGQSSIMRAAVAAFGFVYVHPMIDGNGRIHRFLINDILRRDAVTDPGVILPVSVAIDADATSRRNYESVLDTLSAPLMRKIGDAVSFDAHPTTYPDGVESDLHFTKNDLARPTWRYGNYAPHIQYLAQVLHETIAHHMRSEALYLRSHDTARSAMKNVVEMPDTLADAIIRSVTGNTENTVGKKLRRDYPQMTDEMWTRLTDAVKQAFGLF